MKKLIVFTTCFLALTILFNNKISVYALSDTNEKMNMSTAFELLESYQVVDSFINQYYNAEQKLL